MGEYDLRYITRSVGALSGVPVRLYEKGTRTYAWFPAQLPRDPAERWRGEIFSLTGHVGYFVTPQFHYYGVLHAGDAAIVLGPTAQVATGEQELRRLAFELDVPREEVPSFVSGMNAIAHLAAETLLQLLCTFNHFLNGGETLSISDVAILSEEQERIKTQVETRRTQRTYEEERERNEAHNTLAMEEALMQIIRRGDSGTLKDWISSAPAIRGGTIAPDQLRQLKNTFIVSATLASRAAIRGGMSEDDAFSLSDGYIRRAEVLSDHVRIMNLQYQMILEFTEQVEKLHRGRYPTRLATNVANYVRHHLSEPVSAEKMAESFFMSRPYLSAKFKKETRETLTDFILREKTEEAKRLLRYSDKTVTAIGAYLGFSSAAHFSRVFKKYAQVTPSEYRERIGK